jgi:hypothetical protein
LPRLSLSAREKRETRARVLREFFRSFGILDARAAPIPSSTTEEEIEGRKREVALRLDLLRAVLELTQSELRSLTRRKKRRRAAPAESRKNPLG